ncbi:MAG: DUF1800 family protein [Pseudomonadota bacterium]
MKSLRVASLLLVSTALAGCISGGGDEDADASVPAGPASYTVSGIAAAGLAECRVEATTLDGQSLGDAFIGESNPIAANGTPTDGSYQVDITDFTGPLVITATDCTYIDEASNTVVSGTTMRAFANIPNTVANDGTVTIHITPFSTLAADIAEENAGGIENLNGTQIDDVNERVSTIFFGDDVDIIRTPPIVATQENADETQEASINFGLYLAALSGAGDMDETLERLRSEIDIDAGTLSEAGEEILLEGAAVFEASGYKTVESDSFNALTSTRMQADPTGSAPVINVETDVVSVTAGRAFQITGVAFAEDVDGDLVSLRFRGLPDQVLQSGDNSIAGVIVEAGQYPYMAVAQDSAGNATSQRLFIRAEQPTDANQPGNPGSGQNPSPNPGQGSNPPSGSPNDPQPMPPSQQPNFTMLDSAEDVVHFLMRAGHGGTKAEIDALVGTDAADWVRTQMGMAAEDIFPSVLAIQEQAVAEDRFVNSPHQAENFDQLLGANDDLRQRMQFALSQILVVADRSAEPVTVATYRDILNRNAFGNYRDLLGEVTDSLMMGRWLTYLNNRKGDPNTGRTPDQNYAREILQLFSIGVAELDPDGQPQQDDNGDTIDTYDQDDIAGLARVFTGYRQQSSDNSINGRIRPSNYLPMRMDANRHSELDKVFLETTIPAGTSGEASVALALDAIFAHPNVAPFISRQLIQRFTASNPEPDYVARVSNAFETGRFTASGGQQFGDGRRGSLEATLAAVLLDQTLFDDEIAPTEGKIREPILLLAGWAHSFNLQNVDTENERWMRNVSGGGGQLDQQPYRSPSVFNFYRPGYVAPGTITGAVGLTAPELQIVSALSRDQFTLFMSRQAFDDTNRVDDQTPSYTPDYSELLPLADDPAALVNYLSLYLTGNRMSPETRERIRRVAELYEIRTDDADDEALDREFIVETAVTMAITAPSFAVIY